MPRLASAALFTVASAMAASAMEPIPGDYDCVAVQDGEEIPVGILRIEHGFFIGPLPADTPPDAAHPFEQDELGFVTWDPAFADNAWPGSRVLNAFFDEEQFRYATALELEDGERIVVNCLFTP